ncbi:hypothetical protein [Azospirillum largimobile]
MLPITSWDPYGLRPVAAPEPGKRSGMMLAMGLTLVKRGG